MHPPSIRPPCRRRAPGPDHRAFHVVAHHRARDARVAVVLKGWPRLSETFIAQEIAGLEARGVALEIWSLRRPTDKARHPVHDRVTARTVYLPEYLKDDPRRVLAAWRKARRLPGYKAARRKFLADLRRDPTANRLRRWGQALVLAAELPPSIERLYAHFLHTPASVTRYAATMRGLPWSVSAHAKDIWTSEPWEVAEKLADCSWLVTCTAMGLQRLQGAGAAAGAVEARLSRPRLRPSAAAARARGRGATAANAADPVVILSIGRKVEKKGYDDLLDALARLPRDAPLALRACRRRRAVRSPEGAGRRARHRRALHLASAPSRRRRCSPPWRAPTCSCWRARRPPTATRTACPTC